MKNATNTHSHVLLVMFIIDPIVCHHGMFTNFALQQFTNKLGCIVPNIIDRKVIKRDVINNCIAIATM